MKQSKMALAAAIVSAAYSDASIKNPRAASIEQMVTKLKFEKTTAATYHGHCLRQAREAEQTIAIEKAEKGKKVYSAVKVNADDIVTSVGVFVSRKAAAEFNANYRHDGVQAGVIEPGEVLAGLYEKRRKMIAKQFASKKVA